MLKKELLKKILISEYELNESESEKIVEKIFYILEHNLLVWNKIECKWEII